MKDEQLNEIQEQLDTIVNLLKIIYGNKLITLKKETLRAGSLDKQIYELCDGTNTTSTIAKKLQKNGNHISNTLTKLRKKGLIKSITKNKQKVHVQIF